MAESAPDLLTVHAQQQGDKLAVIDDRPDGPVRQLTFTELNLHANRIANALLALGVEPRNKVLWCGQNSIPLVAMNHAARKIGVTAVPLNYRMSPEEAAYVVDNSDSVVVWTDAAYAGLFVEIRAEIPNVRHVVVFDGAPADGQMAADDFLALGSDDEPAVAERDEATASMIYTSGTTGKPKGALRLSLGSPEQVQGLVQMVGYGIDDVYQTTGPLYHSGPGGFARYAHMLGNTVVVQRKFDPEDWLRLLDKYRVTSTFSAPTPIRMICSLPAEIKAKYDRSSLRIMVANAAPWSYALKQAYLADFPEDSLWEVYGSTEMGVNTVLAPEDQTRKPGSCGKAAPHVEIALFGPDGATVTTPDTPGELFVRASSVFNTYHKAQEKFDAEHRQDGFHTVGDIAYFDEEGYYYICDRKKDMIISGGMNIYPAEVEAALEHHEKIFDVAVIGVPSDEWGESVHAVVVPAPGAALTQDDVTAYAREHLASYKIPRSVSFAEELPRTGSGKLLKRELRKPFWEGRQTSI
jgi:fatty-acyl-CoA synthase/long-chain acyl-CoA synthetase